MSDKHPTDIPGWEGKLEELAYELENLRYDRLAEFLLHLGNALWERGEEDKKAGRTKLSYNLQMGSLKVQHAHNFIGDAWKICKPKMK